MTAKTQGVTPLTDNELDQIFGGQTYVNNRGFNVYESYRCPDCRAWLEKKLTQETVIDVHGTGWGPEIIERTVTVGKCYCPYCDKTWNAADLEKNPDTFYHNFTKGF